MGARRDDIKEDVIMCETLLRMFHRRDFRNDYPLQRKPASWSHPYRDEFIVSVIKNENVDSLKMCEEVTESGSTTWLIDGGNRVRSLDAFKNGEFKIGRTIFMPFTEYTVPRVDEDGVFVEDEKGNQVFDTIKYDLRGKWYRDLPQELKDSFDSYGVKITKRLNATEELIQHDLRRYNNQGKMNNAEISVTYMNKESAKKIKDIAEESRFFVECGAYTESNKNRSIIEKILMETMMASYHLNSWKKNAKKIGAYLAEFATDEEYKKVESNLNRLEKIVDEKSNELFNVKNSYIWFATFDKFTELGLPDESFKNFLHAFVDELHTCKIGDLSWDDMEENRATKDKKTVIQKITLLENLMNQYLCVEEEKEEIDVLNFVRETVDPDANEDDIELYEQTFDDYTVEVDNKSPLLNRKNRPSWIALVADAFKSDTDMNLGKWMIQFFKNNTEFLRNQRDNFLRMKDSFQEFCATPA